MVLPAANLVSANFLDCFAGSAEKCLSPLSQTSAQDTDELLMNIVNNRNFCNNAVRSLGAQPVIELLTNVSPFSPQALRRR